MKKYFCTLRSIILTFCLTLVAGFWSEALAADVLPELQGKYVGLVMPSATDIEKDKWYVMYNVGRKGFLCDDESKLHITVAPPGPDAMKYLVRITDVKGYQVVETGIGRYFKYLSTSNNSGSGTTVSASNAYSYGKIADGYFWLKDKNGMVLDANALGSDINASSTVAGWGKDTPTSTTGNNSWMFFPVEFFDASDEFADVPYAFGNFSFQSVSAGQYLHLDSSNLGLTDEEHTGSVLFNFDGSWTLGVPEGSSSKGYFHIGTDGKFSAGPSSPLRLYRVSESDGNTYTYRQASHVIDGGIYLIVGDYNGSAYALLDKVDNAGTSNQRMLSSKVTFSDDGTAAFIGTHASEPQHHHWQLHYGESLVQNPFVYTVGETGGASGEGAPLLTIACVSDIHTQHGWSTGTSWEDQDNAYYKKKEIKDVRVRETLGAVVKELQRENVDVLIVGGDCNSDATIDEEHWRQVRRLMANALRSVNPAADGKSGAEDIPVLYVNGNHEYEAASTWGANGSGYYNWRYARPYNAGEYYDFPMGEDIGVLASDYDCFYEQAPNEALLATKKTIPVLGAYHYSIKGFDFVVLNCGKHLFHNANNYTYSDESVEWVGRKLQQIYADNPSHQKTVFFALHIPFGDSNSVNTSEDKGMSYFDSTHRLKEILAQYPGLVMLYGHDHGQDLAFIRSKTSQRITRYDTQGQVMATTDGIDHYDKDLTTGEAMKGVEYKGQSVIFHPYSGKTETCLGVKGSYLAGSASPQRTLALLDTPSACTIYPETDGGISMRLGDGSQHLVYNNGFSTSAAEHQQLFLYRVNLDGDHFSVTRTQQAEEGGIYLIASATSIYRNGSARAFTLADTYPTSTYSSYFWTAELPAAAEPSFMSSFMGSLRYYANSNGEPDNTSPIERKLIQGLLIYVYPDRIVFNMKNFRNKVGSRVKNELAPYVVKRTTAAPDSESIVQHNPSGAYYRRVDDLSQLCDKSVCILVDESRKRAIGIADNATNKFQALEVEFSDDDVVALSRNATESEFVFEKKPEGAAPLYAKSNEWYIRTRDGYIKSADSKVFHRQQPLNYCTANPLCNEALKGQIVPWTITLDSEGAASVESAALGQLRKYTNGMTTATFHIYQKVVAPEFDAVSGLAAYYAEHALMMPEGTEAYTVEGVNDDGTLRFVRQTTKVPAKAGLVLRTKDAVGTVELPVIDDRYAAPLTDCLLGTLAELPTSAPMPVAMGAETENYHFYRFDGTTFSAADAAGSAFTNPAGRAYLALPYSLATAYESAAPASIATMLDAAEINGIEDVLCPADASLNAPIYNLSGQRVFAPLRPGIYIVGGKKIIVK